MIDIGPRHKTLERDHPWMHEHRRMINGTLYSFFAQRGYSGKIVLIQVARWERDGFSEYKRFDL